VCVCIIDINTGKYHTHFGANPNFQIALQRTLTECFQGRNIRNISQHVDFSDPKKLVDIRCLLVELLLGTSEKAPQFFCKGLEQPCCQTIGFSGTTNQQYLRECVSYFKELGYDVLVRDSSVLGFPTYQVIIPGYSEVLPQRILGQFNDNRYTMYAGKALRNPVAANHDDLFGLMMHLAQSSKLKVWGLESFTTESGIPATLSAAEEEYWMGLALAHISYTLGRTKDTITYLSKAIQANISENAEYLICFKRYLSMKQAGYSEEEIEKTLQQFHKEETKEKIYSFLQANGNPLDPIVLRCDLQCASTCPLYNNCKKKYVDELVQLIVNKAKSLDQSAMEKMLQNI
jgi:ribosomal protein S12 methylthiotransferase accessory factor